MPRFLYSIVLLLLVSPLHAAEPVLTGIDVLRRDGFKPLQGSRVGLITNQTGIALDGTSTVEVLLKAKGVRLVALFGPEHGIQGKFDQAVIDDGTDASTGLKVYSLYGKTRKPTAESLEGVDTLVFDIQDIGCRFYTFISTMGLAMEAAAEHGIRFVVLDRPNPIGGVLAEGPLQENGRESFVAYHSMPLRHGLSVGELARLFKKERKLDLHLEVVRCENWNPADDFDATGLKWINPSPNMRSTTEAYFYPGVGLWEFTNVSVGRGTDTPFELLGAPWIDPDDFTAALRAESLPGVRFEPITFTPDASVYAGKKCGGVRFILIDRKAFRSVRLGYALGKVLYRLYPEKWNRKRSDGLLFNKRVLDAILADKPLDDIEAMVVPDLEAFQRRCDGCRVYSR